MRRSVSWHFLLYSLAVILVAIVAVGAVTLLLVDANFSRQEEQYLHDQGDQLLEPLQSALQLGGDPADLQSIASLGLMTGHVRIRVVDPEGRVLADSGSYGEVLGAGGGRFDNSSIAAFQLLLEEANDHRSFGWPRDLPESFFPFIATAPSMGFFESMPFEVDIATHPATTGTSNAAVTLPLHVDSQLVGHAEISEGPAFNQAIRDTLRQSLIIGGLVALIVAAVAAMVAARQVTRPLHSLGIAANETALGNLEARAEGSKLAEIDHLAQQFNTMADQLAATIASLEAERSSLRRFIADASHELRTPLTALKTFNSLLAEDLEKETGRSAKLVRESGRQINQLDRLTTDLLDLSRLESRLNGTDLVIADLRPTIEGAASAIQQLSEDKAQTLRMSLGHSIVMVAHDQVMIERAVQNMLSNAVKFSPPGSVVQLSLVADERYASVHIRDNGPGILESEQPYIFNRFYRGRSAQGEGNGLGLAIVREIAAVHGGDVTFTSQVHKGSQFTLRLPLAN